MTPETRRRAVLIAGDLAALFLFSYLGREAHELAGFGALLLLAAEFWAAWLLAGWLAGAFALPGGVGSFMRRSLLAWLAAAPLAAVLRALVLGRAVIPTVFLLVTLGIGGAFVLVWRLGFALYWRRR